MHLPELPCQIPELSLGCFGCCGREYGQKEQVLLNIHKNTLSWKENTKQKEGEGKLTLKQFCYRQTALTRCGVCVNIIEEKGMFVCAVHPRMNKEEEVRENYCNTKFLCRAAKAWNEFSPEEKQLYLAFLKQKVAQGMDAYAYSMHNANDELIAEFVQSKGAVQQGR